MATLLAADARITDFVPAATVPALLDATEHVGDATERALAIVDQIRSAVIVQPEPAV